MNSSFLSLAFLLISYPHANMQYFIWDTIIELYNIILMSLGIKYFSLFRTPTNLEMLFDILSQWFFQLRFSFNISRRKLKSLILQCSPRKLKSGTSSYSIMFWISISGRIMFFMNIIPSLDNWYPPPPLTKEKLSLNS